MRCKNCSYVTYDYAEDYEICVFGFEEENSKGEIGCKYTEKQLSKFLKEMEEAEAEEYERMGKYFSEHPEEV